MKTPSTITLCTIQPAITWNDPTQTFEQIEELLAQACQESRPNIVVLPEHFNAAFDPPGENRQWQAAQDFASQLARSHNVNLIAGSVERWDADADARFNTALVLDRQGREVGRYDKRRLFGFEKQRQVQPGRRSLVVELDGVRCGLLICADMWFPELVREVAPEIELLCAPSQTVIRPESNPAYARLLWRSIALTRAQENVLAVVVSDQAATTTAPYRCGGVSTICDPSAEPDLRAIQQVLSGGEAGYLLGRVDMARLRKFRRYRRGNGLLPDWPEVGYSK